ncbi:NADH-quinone oxidoreductase subunit H [Streptomyces neyagawaensis]|uniref:NADH-quinone oxidoreductase subunit H n=1 Tax=Streptomyces neyagawaensis TaxID=42238 RepID=UPI0006E2C06B|nr:NADH-quinone oxidoreductase subunit H [Streptomyces neyagawaensis]MCL6734835.1 NADH-quinone oxidoreductase subunit H [Streptomyces neyagawaensis]MDE1686499.1 NADH-quinone oxidoreductase subunit H [Streptomyces neyagawaensis]
MAEAAPLWATLVLPLALAAAAVATAGFDAVLSASAERGPAAGPREAGLRALAPVREALRLLVQQPRRTTADDRLLGRLGVVLVPVAAVLAGAVLPWGFSAVSDPPVGIVWFNAMEVLAWAAVWLTGWGPNSALALIGGHRFLAQGLAYELPHMLAITTAALGAGSLRIGEVVAAQDGLWFVVWMPGAFAVYLSSALAMAFWGPFAHPVARDAAGGAAAELAGVDRLVFLGGRWLLLVVTAGFSVPLFLGGGNGPLLPGWAWTLLKTAAVLALLVAGRRALPVLRMERYMEVAWTVLVPVTLLQALVVAVVVLNG